MSQHILSVKVYITIFFALLVFTVLTTWVAFIDLGPLNDAVALGIAIVKALLVILYFMHVRYSSKLTWVFIATGFLFLIILFAFTMSDVLTRELIEPLGWTNGISIQ